MSLQEFESYNYKNYLILIQEDEIFCTKREEIKDEILPSFLKKDLEVKERTEEIIKIKILGEEFVFYKKDCGFLFKLIKDIQEEIISVESKINSNFFEKMAKKRKLSGIVSENYNIEDLKNKSIFSLKPKWQFQKIKERSIKIQCKSNEIKYFLDLELEIFFLFNNSGIIKQNLKQIINMDSTKMKFKGKQEITLASYIRLEDILVVPKNYFWESMEEMKLNLKINFKLERM